MKDIYLLVLGRFMSFFGSAMYSVCIPLYILKTTGSLVSAGTFFAITRIPIVLITPILGNFVSRHDLKKCLVYADLISSIFFFVLALFMASYGNNLVFLGFISILMGITESVFSISSSSIFIHLVPDNNLERYNGMKSIGDNLALSIAPVIGTILFGFYGLFVVVIINAVSYLLSAISELFLTYQFNETVNENKVRLFDFKEIFNYLINHKEIFCFFILPMILNFLVAPLEEIFAPGIVIGIHNVSEKIYGLTNLAFIAGVMLASVYVSFKKQLNLYPNMRYFFYAQGILMISIGSLSMLLMKEANLFFVCYLLFCLIAGICCTLVNIPLISNFQIMVEASMQPRFFALLSFFSQCMIPLGIFYAGFMSQLVRADLAYLSNGVLMIFCVYVLYQRIDKLSKQG